jgi:hypothetical protein
MHLLKIENHQLRLLPHRQQEVSQQVPVYPLLGETEEVGVLAVDVVGENAESEGGEMGVGGEEDGHSLGCREERSEAYVGEVKEGKEEGERGKTFRGEKWGEKKTTN